MPTAKAGIKKTRIFFSVSPGSIDVSHVDDVPIFEAVLRKHRNYIDSSTYQAIHLGTYLNDELIVAVLFLEQAHRVESRVV